MRKQGDPISASVITAGKLHSCAIVNDGSVQCWGSNAYGQLGDGTAELTEYQFAWNSGGPGIRGFMKSGFLPRLRLV